ncbi:MAG: class I SAM-dependent methyltransferase [Thermoplasmata archaeon]|nr:class I SAM-dependent methyltransferase [Thermoplasmata archaeon]
MFYKLSFTCDDRERVQRRLNSIYDYDDLGHKISHRNRMNLFHVMMKRLIRERTIASFDSALDIGCNSGVYSKMISDLGFKHVLGVDIDAKEIKRAEEFFAFDTDRKSLEYRVMNAEKMDTKKKYDLILCTEVIEHTKHPNRVVKNIEGMLAPGGGAIITLPNLASLPYMGIAVFNKVKGLKLDREMEQHLAYPFYRSLKLFDRTSLNVIRTSGTNILFDSITLRRIYGTPLFPVLNRLTFQWGRRWPLKYFTQFFFMVLQKDRE